MTWLMNNELLILKRNENIIYWQIVLNNQYYTEQNDGFLKILGGSTKARINQ